MALTPLERYTSAVHRVQSAIALRFGQELAGVLPSIVRRFKHNRVGIDMAKAEQGELARLLIAKGVFTEEEYLEAMSVAAEREADLQAEATRRECGLPDTVRFG